MTSNLRSRIDAVLELDEAVTSTLKELSELQGYEPSYIELANGFEALGVSTYKHEAAKKSLAEQSPTMVAIIRDLESIVLKQREALDKIYNVDPYSHDLGDAVRWSKEALALSAQLVGE